jgi:microcystin-dependent protein
MGNAFNGHCDTSSNGVQAGVINNTNTGSAIYSGTSFTGNKQIIKNTNPNTLTSCNSQQNNLSQSNPFLPNIDDSIVQNYYTGDFTVKNLSVAQSCNQIPRGIIIIWTKNVIPQGWALCDGTNCTPDLRGKSIYGYDSTKNKIGDQGGEETHLLTIGEIPPHSHSYLINNSPISMLTGVTGSDKDYTTGLTGKSKNVNYSALNNSKNIPHNNMPPYSVYSYIMKL